MGKRKQGVLTRDICDQLKTAIIDADRSDLTLYCDHGAKGKSSYAVPFFGEYGNATTLAHIDITIVRDDKVVLFCEVEENANDPKRMIGIIDNLFVAERAQINGKPYEFDGAFLVLGLFVGEGKGGEKAAALCSRVPSIVLEHARKGMQVVPVIVKKKDDLVPAVKEQICRLMGIEVKGGQTYSTGDLFIDLGAACGSIISNHRTEVSTRIVSGFLNAAEIDLKASRLMFNHGLYAPSTYHLQQAVEKMVKAFLLHIELMSPSEIRGISHNSLLGLILLGEKVSPATEILSNHLKGIETDLSILDSFNNDEEVSRYTKKQIDVFLTMFDSTWTIGSIGDLALQLTGDPEAFKKLQEAAIFNYERPNVAEKCESTIAPSSGSTSQIAFMTLGLILLAIPTFPHEAHTRYPYDEGHLGPSDYTMELGIVSSTPALLDRIDRAIIKLRELINLPKE
jgi:HEPN domain-containing protein